MRKINRFLFLCIASFLTLTLMIPPTDARMPHTSELRPIINNGATLTVLRYYDNGTIQTTSITLSEIRARCFIKEIQNATGLQERITIYQNYRLITDSSQELLQYAREQQDKQKHETNEQNPWRNDHTLNTLLHIAVFANVSGSGSGYYWSSMIYLPIGITLNTNTQGRTTKYFRADIVNHCLGYFSFQATGKFHKLYGAFTGAIKMVGFVGYYYEVTGKHGYIGTGFDGFALYTRAIGLFS